MGRQPAALDFALIGHLESWQQLHLVLSDLRDLHRPPLSQEDVREIAPWIPPRTIARLTVRSYPSGREVRGVYVETFITPDKLTAADFRENRQRIRQALDYAQAEGARVIALGGFTKISGDGANTSFTDATAAVTTGNTLAAALIVKRVEETLRQRGQPLSEARVLVVGASGDVGSACARYFAHLTDHLLLCARTLPPLERLASELAPYARHVQCSCDLDVLLPLADVVIFLTSSPEPIFSLASCQGGALVCDAGYPRNVLPATQVASHVQLFRGGLGQVLGGITIEPDLRRAFPCYPHANIGFGCLLEGPLLALAGRYEPFSSGRGLITPARIEEIWGVAQEHGFVTAPLAIAAGA